MIFGNIEKVKVHQIGDVQSKKMSLSQDNQEVLISILSEGLYSDPIGSIVREYTTNALDACKEAGIDEPIIVEIYKHKGQDYFSVQDFGIGISPWRMNNVIDKFAASTKRETNDQLGAFGLGMKCAHSYTTAFFIETIHDGKYGKYMMRKGETVPEIDTIEEKDTTERNGTKITVPIKNGDVYNFKEKIEEQLCYFKNVYFKNVDVDNDFEIIEAEDWKWSEINTNNYLHISFSDVYYPIDWDKLGISPIYIPIALKFDVGCGITPTPNRENIIYNTKTKQLILNKIEKVANDLVSRYNVAYTDVEDVYNLFDKNCDILSIGDSFNISIINIEKFTTINKITPTIKNIPSQVSDIILKKYCGIKYKFPFLKFKGKIENNKWSSKLPERKSFYSYLGEFTNEEICYISNEEVVKGIKRTYIKDNYENLLFFTYSPPNEVEMNKFFSLSLEMVKTEREVFYKAIDTISQMIISNFINYNDIIVTEDWKKARKNARKEAIRVKIENEEINPKFARESLVGGRVVFESGGPVKNNLTKTIIYGEIKDKELLSDLFWEIRNAKILDKVSIAILPKRDINKIINLKNYIEVNNFIKGGTEIFSDICTALYAASILNRNRLVCENEEVLKHCNEEVYNNFVKVEKFCDENKGNDSVYYNSWQKFKMNSFNKELLNIAKENNCWNKEIYDIVNILKVELPKFQFLEHLATYGTVKHEAYNFIKQVYEKFNN